MSRRSLVSLLFSFFSSRPLLPDPNALTGRRRLDTDLHQITAAFPVHSGTDADGAVVVYRKLAGKLDVVRSLAFDADGVKLHRKSKVFGVTAGTLFQVLYQTRLCFLHMRVRVVIRNNVVNQLGMKVELGECVSMSAHGFRAQS